MSRDEAPCLAPFGHGHNTQTFILRVWRDPGEGDGDAGEWWARIRHVGHEDKETPLRLESIAEVVRAMLAADQRSSDERDD